MRLISRRLLKAVLRPAEIDDQNPYSVQVAALLNVAGYLVRQRGMRKEDFLMLADALWDQHEVEVQEGKKPKLTLLKGGG